MPGTLYFRNLGCHISTVRGPSKTSTLAANLVRTGGSCASDGEYYALLLSHIDEKLLFH